MTYEPDDVISETPEYSPKSDFNKPKLVEEAVRKCIDARGKEMREGYNNYTFDKDGHAVKTWIPDSRKEFIGCVIALRNLLNPECRRSKEYKKFEETLIQNKNKLKENYSYKEMRFKMGPKGYLWSETNNIYLPSIDEMFHVPDRNNAPMKVVGLWNGKINAYYDELLELYDEMFGILNNLIDKLNYFKSEISF